jgi:uncharacterized protein (DUF2225 family)
MIQLSKLLAAYLLSCNCTYGIHRSVANACSAAIAAILYHEGQNRDRNKNYNECNVRANPTHYRHNKVLCFNTLNRKNKIRSANNGLIGRISKRME